MGLLSTQRMQFCTLILRRLFEQILYIGDSKYDSLCAKNAEVDFALAMWGSHTRELEADYFIETSNDLLGAIK